MSKLGFHDETLELVGSLLLVIILATSIIAIVSLVLSQYTSYITFTRKDVILFWYSAFLVVIVALLSEILYVLWQIKCAINDGEGCK